MHLKLFALALLTLSASGLHAVEAEDISVVIKNFDYSPMDLNIVPGTTVVIERDAAGDEEERPLKMKLVKPRKRPAKKREPVGVGATSGDGDGAPSSSDPGPDADAGDDAGEAPAPEQEPEAPAEPQ